MVALAVRTLLLLASACYGESASVLNLSRKYASIPGSGLGIYGGHRVNTTVPYYAMLNSKTKLYIPCGAGAIVHKQFVLTTGNCGTKMIKNNLNDHVVVVGTNDFSIGGHVYKIEKVFIHPKFIIKYLPDKMLWDYDIAVIKLKGTLTFNDRVQPIKMADPDFVLKVGDQVVSYGMGETSDMVVPLHLRSVSLPYYDHKKCIETFYGYVHLNVTERFFCAGGETGISTVLGDYGGPVVYNDTLVGLNSFALMPFAMSGVPSGYLSISVMRPFIDGVIKMDD